MFSPESKKLSPPWMARAALAAVCTAFSFGVQAQAPAASAPAASAPAAAAPAVKLAPVLERLKAGAPFVIAHREASVPFSYYDDNKKPVGYALELCQKLAAVVQKQLKLKDMKIEYKMVTGAMRIPTIEKGEAMLECGSTTNNAERREKVAFTVPHFSQQRSAAAHDHH
jgi:ABC-type amino acid transport substrate-binding protein